MELILLGTGHAIVSECYNTCFALKENDRVFLVDAGGGNQILSQLKKASIELNQIHDIFVTHAHTDHVLGIFWIIRMLLSIPLDHQVCLYSHQEVIDFIKMVVEILLPKKQTERIGKDLLLIPVEDKQCVDILYHPTTFFDIHSSKMKQFGFTMDYDYECKLTCLGDEPYNDHEKEYASKSTWLLHEAFCLDSHADVFHPYEKHHSTVKDACINAKALDVKNLVVYHSEDKTILMRKELYNEEGKKYFDGNLYVPLDLERINL